MKISSVSKFISAGVIAASLAIFPSTVFAQTQTDTAPNTSEQRAGDVEATNTDNENDSDWGWLGLLGLAGLAGLIPKKRQETVYRSNTEPDVATRSRSDFR